MQATLNNPVSFEGFGLHSGMDTRVTLRPAPVGHGIVFRRTDIVGRDPLIPAMYDFVDDRPLCTHMVNADGVDVMTIEHILAAVTGCGIRNVLIDVYGSEIPIMDGSATSFVRGLIAAGIVQQNAIQTAIEIVQPVMIEDGGAVAMLTPARSLEIDFQIEFEDRAIGSQAKFLNMTNGTFVRELADSRTFCRKSDIDRMQANGLALGGSYENAIVVDGDVILTPGGLRHADEAVRHKMLDAFGDLALAGQPILGRYTGLKAGHSMTNRLLRKLFATPAAYRIVNCTYEQLLALPGAGVRHADLELVA